MDDKKNPHPWRAWIITATMVIQLLTAFEYYNMYRNLHEFALLQKTALEYQIEAMKAVNQNLGRFQ